MSKFRNILFIAIISIGFLSNCVEDQDLGKNAPPQKKRIDGITMATPDGGELKPAEEGPVRSVSGTPSINLDTFQLTVTGLVDFSYSLSWEEIKQLPVAFTDTMIMYCVEGWEVWGKWKGVLIKDLLEVARVHTDGDYIVFESLDGYETALSISYLEKYNAMLAYQVNSDWLQEQDGFPLRLIAFGKFGYKWSKWVYELNVINSSQADYSHLLGSGPANVPVDRRIYYEGDGAIPLEY